MPRQVFALIVLALAFAALTGIACATGGKGGGKPDIARGQKYYMAKCNACHPNGNAGAGPALFGSGHAPPGPILKSSAGGRHNVAEPEFDSLMLYLAEQMKAPATAPSTTPVTPVTPGAMRPCACSCQCPADMPPGQMANCTCQCQCQ